MTRCRLVHGNRCLGLTCCLHLRSSPGTIDCHEYEGSKQATAETSLLYVNLRSATSECDWILLSHAQYLDMYLMFVDPCIIVQFIKNNPTRCRNVSKFYYSIFIWSSTCFGRHTAHHQEPKTALAASGFSYVVGRVDGGRCQAHCAWQRPPSTRPTTFHVLKTRGCQCSFRLLMMDGVSPETWWASYKYGIIKCWYIVASCWIFLYEYDSLCASRHS